MNLISLLLYIGIPAIIAFVTVGIILARLYKRATKEVSFVRTGAFGQRVIMDGGAVVLPVFHETVPVNMNTLRGISCQ